LSTLTIILIAIGLAMDAFAVSITEGVKIRCLGLRAPLIIAFLFGLFQAVMPVIGWIAGMGLVNFISAFAHWVVCGILCFIGAKMMFESGALKQRECRKSCPCSLIYVLAIATSLDALAVGISMSLLNVSIIKPALFIGAVTFILSFLGVMIGIRTRNLYADRIEIIGGIILIGIGIKILLQNIL